MCSSDLRAAVADLVEEWRVISFRWSGDEPGLSEIDPGGSAPGAVAAGGPQLHGPRLRSAVRCERTGDEGRAISCDGAATAAHLGELGARNVRPAPMSIDDIAVEIMKGGYRVAAG